MFDTPTETSQNNIDEQITLFKSIIPKLSDDVKNVILEELKKPSEKQLKYLRENPDLIQLFSGKPEYSDFIKNFVVEKWENFKIIPKEHQTKELIHHVHSIYPEKMVYLINYINFDILQEIDPINEAIYSTCIAKRFNHINHITFFPVPKEYQTKPYVQKFYDLISVQNINTDYVTDDIVEYYIKKDSSWDDSIKYLVNNLTEDLIMNILNRGICLGFHPKFIEFMKSKPEWEKYKNFILNAEGSNYKEFKGKLILIENIAWMIDEDSVIEYLDNNQELFEYLMKTNKSFIEDVKTNPSFYKTFIDSIGK